MEPFAGAHGVLCILPAVGARDIARFSGVSWVALVGHYRCWHDGYGLRCQKVRVERDERVFFVGVTQHCQNGWGFLRGAVKGQEIQEVDGPQQVHKGKLFWTFATKR